MDDLKELECHKNGTVSIFIHYKNRTKTFRVKYKDAKEFEHKQVNEKNNLPTNS